MGHIHAGFIYALQYLLIHYCTTDCVLIDMMLQGYRGGGWVKLIIIIAVDSPPPLDLASLVGPACLALA